MKTMQNTARWLGLVLAGSIITLAASGQAGKPVKPPKPPPEPPPAAAYDLVWLEPGSYANDVNDSGLVLGRTYPPSADDYLSLVVPQEDNGSIVWHKDNDSDGHNDLLIDLGVPSWGWGDSHAWEISDNGVILGSRPRPIPGTQYYTQFAWFLAPQVINGQLTWATLDNDGVNGLITPLHAADDPYVEVTPMSINNHGEVALVINDGVLVFFDGVVTGQRGFLLLPNVYEVSPEGAVTIEYPAEDLDSDGLNDSLIDLGMGIRISDGGAGHLLPSVINNRGDVAGRASKGGVGTERPFVLRPRVDENLGLIWNEDNNGDGLNDLVRYLPLPAEVIAAAPSYSGCCSISDMNESGTIIGSVSYPAPKGNRAAIWQVDWEAGTVTYTELGPVGNFKISQACAVNAPGQVVGYSLKYMKSGYVQRIGWLWDQGNVVPLSDLVPGLANGYTSALGINDSGMIVGSHQSDYTGPSTSFIAVPVDQP